MYQEDVGVVNGLRIVVAVEGRQVDDDVALPDEGFQPGEIGKEFILKGNSG